MQRHKHELLLFPLFMLALNPATQFTMWHHRRTSHIYKRGILFINGLRSGPRKQTGEKTKEANSSATDGVKLLEI